MNQHLKFFLKAILIIGGTLLGVFLSFRLALYLAPFVIAFVVASAIEPSIKLLMKKTKMRRKAASVISLLIVLVVFGVLMALLVSRIYQEALSLSDTLPKYISEVYENIRNLIDKASEIYLGLPEEITKNIEGMIANFSDTLSKVGSSFVKGLLNTAVSIPQAMIFVIVTILSTYFIAGDRDKISDYIKSNLPESWLDKVLSIKNDMFAALFGYIRAQLILMSITFVELSVGFKIIGIKHFILLALGISIIDALPILGTGGVLIPWSIYEFLTGDIRTAVSLLILYGVVLVVRQMIEPKVLGQQIGLHPLVTLIAMYLGLQIFGFIGLIIGPVTLLLLKNIITGIVKQKSLKDFINQYK